MRDISARWPSVLFGTSAGPVRRLIGAFGAVVILGLSLAFPRTTLAAGTASCSDIYHSYWRGQQVGGVGTKHGASGTASGYALQICTSPVGISTDGSWYFSNVVSNTHAANDIIQVGYGQERCPFCPQGENYFVAWGRTGNEPGGCEGLSDRSPTSSSVGTSPAGSHTYGVNHVANEWRFYIDGAVKGTSVPEGSICWSPSYAVWFSETWDFGDQMGGLAGDKLHVTGTTYQNTEGGGFVYTSFNSANACNYVANGSPYFCDVTTTTSLDFWTSR